jgi:VWFA-related protein
MSSRSLRVPAAALVVLWIALASGQTASTQQQIPGAIRSGITLVPLDVRVLDRHGLPVTGLTADDFTVLEDGTPQKIGHFAFQELTPGAPGQARPALRRRLDAPLQEQGHRTFLIVLGRGRLQYPARGYDGVIRFIRDQLLPQDKVAIAAWNRTTDFTTDHARLLPLLERLRLGHEKVDAKLRHRESGLEAIYGSKTLPPHIQREIDALFDDEGLRPRELASVRIRDQQGMDNALRRETEAIMERMTGEGAALDDPTLESFFSQAMVGQQTLATLYASIEYLKYFDGEKHLILLNDGGIYLPRAEDDRGLAATAADARVAVHTILTGGVPPAGGNTEMAIADARIIGSSGPLQSAFDHALASFGASSPAAPLFAVGTMRTFAKTSGGIMSAYKKAATTLDLIDRATRSQYIVGYYPANPARDGRFRKVEVRVNRPGVTVHVRGGYFATDQIVPLDRRQFLTYSRISSAGQYPRSIQDIRVTLKASAGRGEVIAEGTIDPVRLSYESVDGVRGGEIDLAIYVGDRDEDVIGEQWQKIAVRLGDESFRRATAKGIPFSVRIPVKGTPRYVKAIVYDYAADLVGSATVRLR